MQDRATPGAQQIFFPFQKIDCDQRRKEKEKRRKRRDKNSSPFQLSSLRQDRKGEQKKKGKKCPDI